MEEDKGSSAYFYVALKNTREEPSYLREKILAKSPLPELQGLPELIRKGTAMWVEEGKEPVLRRRRDLSGLVCSSRAMESVSERGRNAGKRIKTALGRETFLREEEEAYSLSTSR